MKASMRIIPVIATLVLGGCKGTTTVVPGAGTPKWVPSEATSFRGSSATPPHNLSPTEYPFDAAGNYLPDMAAQGQKRFGGSVASSPPRRSTASSSSSSRRSSSSSSKTHRIRSGDTLWGLSRKYGVSVAAIKKANGMSSDKLINGKTLRIP